MIVCFGTILALAALCVIVYPRTCVFAGVRLLVRLNSLAPPLMGEHILAVPVWTFRILAGESALVADGELRCTTIA
jgi:hypothetical protein